MSKILLITVLLLSLLGCAKSELHNAMEEMGESFKAMEESESLAVMDNELSRFQAALDTARQQTLSEEHHSSFEEGTDKIAELAAQLRQAVDAGDNQQARALLKKMRSTRKEYHDKLEVD